MCSPAESRDSRQTERGRERTFSVAFAVALSAIRCKRWLLSRNLLQSAAHKPALSAGPRMWKSSFKEKALCKVWLKSSQRRSKLAERTAPNSPKSLQLLLRDREETGNAPETIILSGKVEGQRQEWRRGGMVLQPSRTCEPRGHR
ncbi:unnamed protein product [Pleuronectes platessa]|uniref:Uncharacterized protein n=1 Tax=Pleuronectes platessa TaxID=8262 RepID=A0A9N7UA71_PLEPL|nr:unnamed protein product [Pleuronectes platessa]